MLQKIKSCKNIAILAVIAIFGLTSCKKKEKEESKPVLQIPSNYDGANFTTNSTNTKTIADQLTALVNKAKEGRDSTKIVSKTDLDNLFTTGTTSLASIATTYYKNRLDAATGWFNDLAQASGSGYTPGSFVDQGGVYGGYLFDENGLELEQMIEKGLFGAALYNYVVSLLANNPTSATVDQALVLYGAKPAFANSGSATVPAENRDIFMANYAARRSDINDNNSLYIQLKNQFIRLQAAIKQGSQFNDDRNDAISKIKLTWEKVNAATAINYCHSATSTLSSTNPTTAQKAGALHSICEAIGFLHGYRTVPQEHKKITDAQIDEVLTLLNAPYNGTPTPYTFITDATNQVPKLQQVITKLKDIYGFTSTEIESFKKNWVAEQGR
jgi:hypothetical protein